MSSILPQPDAQPYVGPQPEGGTPPTYPLWMYNPTLPAQLVNNVQEQDALVASAPGWVPMYQPPYVPPVIPEGQLASFLGSFSTFTFLVASYPITQIPTGTFPIAYSQDQGWALWNGTAWIVVSGQVSPNPVQLGTGAAIPATATNVVYTGPAGGSLVLPTIVQNGKSTPIPISNPSAGTLTLTASQPINGKSTLVIPSNSDAIAVPCQNSTSLYWSVTVAAVTVSNSDGLLSVSGTAPGNSFTVNAASALKGAINVLSGVYVSTSLPAASANAYKYASTTDLGAVYSNGSTWQQLFNVASGSMAITSGGPLPPGQNGTNYSYQLAASSGVSPYTWSLISQYGVANPYAISSSGVLTCANPRNGTTSLVVQVQDSTGATTEKVVTVSIVGTLTPAVAPTFTPSAGNFPTGPTVTISSASGGTIYYTTNGSSPSTSSPSFASGGTVTLSATATLKAICVATGYTQSAVTSGVFTVAALAIGTISLATAYVGSAYNQVMAASGGLPPYTWAVTSGTIPAGLALSPAGVWSGTPTATSSPSLTIQVTDAAGNTANTTLTLTVSAAVTVPGIMSAPVATAGDGTVAVTYTAPSTGGSPITGYVGQILPGSVPNVTVGPVLTMTFTGLTDGTQYSVEVKAINAVGQSASWSPASNLVTPNPATGALTISTTSLPTATVGTPYSQTVTATGGIPPYTWSLPGTPAFGSVVASGTPSTTFSGTPTAAGTYNIVFSVSDSAGTAGFPVLRQVAFNASSGGTSQLTIAQTFAQATLPGSLIVVCAACSYYVGHVVAGVADAVNSAYTEVIVTNDPVTNATQHQSVWAKVNASALTTSQAITATMTGSEDYLGICIMEWTNVPSANAIAGSVGQYFGLTNSNANNCSSGSYNFGTQPIALVGFFQCDIGTASPYAPTVGTGFTAQGTPNWIWSTGQNNLLVETQNIANPGTTAATASGKSGNHLIGQAIGIFGVGTANNTAQRTIPISVQSAGSLVLPTAPTALTMVSQGQTTVGGSTISGGLPVLQAPNTQAFKFTAATAGTNPIASYNAYRTAANAAVNSAYTKIITGITPAALGFTDINATNCVSATKGSVAGGVVNFQASTYFYKVSAVDSKGNEGPLSATQQCIIAANGQVGVTLASGCNAYGLAGDLSGSNAAAVYNSTNPTPQSPHTQCISVTFSVANGFWLPTFGNWFSEWDLWSGAYDTLSIDIWSATGNDIKMFAEVCGDIQNLNSLGTQFYVLFSSYGGVVKGAWTTIQIPLGDLLTSYGPSGVGPAVIQNALYKVLLQDVTGAYGYQIGIDNIKLLKINQGASGTGLSLQVSGSNFINGEGQAVSLNGVNISGLENSSAQGSTTPGSDSGFSGIPPFSVLANTWKANCVRLPINASSWLGASSPINSVCYNGDGTKNSQNGNPDPSGNYRSVVQAWVAAANAAGLYVILDLHWCAPAFTLGGTAGRYLMPLGQSPMADYETAIAFWTSIANTFKSNLSVIFELFNEPYLGSDGATLTAVGGGGITAQQALLLGANSSQFPNHTGLPNYNPIVQSWQVAGMQQLLNTIIGTGAQNVVLVGCLGYSADMSVYATSSGLVTANIPVDSRGQMGFIQHPYPPTQFPSGTPTITNGGSGWTAADVTNGTTITLATPVGCYYATIVKITGVSGGAVTSASYVSYAFPNAFSNVNGLWLQTMLPSGAVAQATTTGSGTGVTITLGGWTNYAGQQNLPTDPTYGWAVVQQVAAVYPVVLTETGDHNYGGNTSTAPWLAQLLPWAAQYLDGVIGWGWYAVSPQYNPDYILISDTAADPTAGYGVYFKNWLISQA